MGFLGRRLMSPATGLLAAGIAAFGPLWVQPSGKVLSESVYLVIVPLLLLAALRCIERPSRLRFAAVGLAIGIAALTRSEAMSLILLLGIPLVIFATRSWRERARFGLILAGGIRSHCRPVAHSERCRDGRVYRIDRQWHHFGGRVQPRHLRSEQPPLRKL